MRRQNLVLLLYSQKSFCDGLCKDSLQLVVEVALVLLATGAAGTRVHLGGDGVGDVGQFLLLLLKVLGGGLVAVLLEPVGGLLDGLEKLYLVSYCYLGIVLGNLQSPCPRRQSCHQDPRHR